MRTHIIIRTYVDKDNPKLEIFTAAEFADCLTADRGKDYSLGQFIFGRDTIILI